MNQVLSKIGAGIATATIVVCPLIDFIKTKCKSYKWLRRLLMIHGESLSRSMISGNKN